MKQQRLLIGLKLHVEDFLSFHSECSNASFFSSLNGGLQLQKLTDKFLSGGMIIQCGGGAEKKGRGREFAGPPESAAEYSF